MNGSAASRQSPAASADIDSYFAERRALVEEFLDKCVPPEDAAPETIVDPVLGGAAPPRPMPYGDFFHASPLEFKQCRQKAMHPVERRQSARLSGPHHLERATDVRGLVPEDGGSDPIGDAGRTVG